MKGKADHRQNVLCKIHVQSTATITDFQYNHNGSQLAVADSDGYVFIYQRQTDNFVRTAAFKADEAAIWKLAWADPSFGDVIALGSFKRKVAVYQLRAGHWTEIAYHQNHEGSVNHVQWASTAYGCKLYSAGSDGSVAILQLNKNSWVSSSFFAHQCSVTSLAVRPVPLNESGEERSGYPLIATAAKDNSVKIWKHTSEIPQEQLDQHARIYQQLAMLKAHKQAIRCVLWKERWAQSSPLQYELFTCSDDGSVKLTSFVNNEVKESTVICEYEYPVFRIAQSMTGNLLAVSVGGEEEGNYLYEESGAQNEWTLVEQLK